MPLAKLADRAEIRVAQPSHRHKVDALVAGPINPPRRVDPLAVGIKQKCRHHPRIDRKSTRLNSRSQSNLVCRLLLEKKKKSNKPGNHLKVKKDKRADLGVVN